MYLKDGSEMPRQKDGGEMSKKKDGDEMPRKKDGGGIHCSKVCNVP